MQVGVIGSNESQCSGELYQFAYKVGLLLGRQGCIVFNGGMQGTMEAVAKGVGESDNPMSTVIGILPNDHKNGANKFSDVLIPTGIGYARNSVIILASDIVIALGGGAGTLNEISYAWQYGKRVLCYTGTEGWSSKLAGTNLDQRRSDLLIGFESIEELSKLLLDE